MLVKCIVLFGLCIGFSFAANPVRYDFFTGKKVTNQQLQIYQQNNVTNTCTLSIEQCDTSEYRRIDGSCNNLKSPARGTFFVPMRRLLPAHYHDGFRSRKAQSGNDLTLARVVRLYLLKSGKSRHNIYNQNLPGFGVFYFMDIGSTHDISNMLFIHPVCCLPDHLNDDKCTPNFLREDDPVHRFSGIRCMNSTRPLTFQDSKCTSESAPALISRATSAMDLSLIYNFQNQGTKTVRSFKGGLLRLEEEDGTYFLPNGPTASCANNIKALGETRCFENHSNGLLPVVLFELWFARNHNYYAGKLAEINPCWNDEKLFYEARELNIAHFLQIKFYEWLPEVIGRKNLIEAGVISSDKGHRDIYNKNLYPEISVEYNYGFRWFHLMQESTAKFYDEDGTYLKESSMFNMTFRPGFLATNDHLSQLTQGTFRVPCHDHDHSVDYEIADNGLPNLQLSLDITAGDLNKGRHFGVAPYIDYVYKFTSKQINCFDDLEFLIAPEKIKVLREVYEHVADIDLMAGLWAENIMKGGHIPYTLAKIIIENSLRNIKADRHWYESKNRPHAFTSDQLSQVRKMNLANLLCNVGDTVSEIPKRAFLTVSPSNPVKDCESLPKINFKAWRDPQCMRRRN